MSDIFGGGGGTVQTNTVQNSDPWAGVQPYLTDVFSRGQALGNRTPFSYAPSPYTTQAENITAQRALDPNSLINQSSALLGNTITGHYLNPDLNPYLKASVNDALGLAGSAFAKQYGGAAGSNLSNSGYQEGLARTLGNVATNAYSNAYGQERQNQLQATQLAPSFQNADAAALGGVGAAQEARALAQYQAPVQNLSDYQRAITGQFGGQTSTSGQTPYFSNPLANALGMGIGGLGLYKGLSAAGLFGGATAAAPALGTAGMGDLMWLAA